LQTQIKEFDFVRCSPLAFIDSELAFTVLVHCEKTYPDPRISPKIRTENFFIVVNLVYRSILNVVKLNLKMKCLHAQLLYLYFHFTVFAMETNIDKLIRLSLLVLLVLASLVILAPFAILLIWGVIIAVAIYPLFLRVSKKLGGRKNLASALFTITGLAIILVPTILITGSSASGYDFLVERFNQGTLTIPIPQEEVKAWPIIGEKAFSIWNLAAHNLKEFINTYAEELKQYGSWLIEAIAGLGLTILQFMISIIIAGVLLAQAEAGNKTIHQFAKRLVGDQGEDFIKLTGGTIRSVVQGILGIALIQCFASAILFIISGIPFPGLWAVLILILAILQLPPLLVLGPIAVYVFSEFDTTPAIVFTVFAVLISISDSLLKPIFLGRGVDVPMMVVLLGAIGGMIAFGILGLFVGAVVLALSYKLMMEWVKAE